MTTNQTLWLLKAIKELDRSQQPPYVNQILELLDGDGFLDAEIKRLRAGKKCSESVEYRGTLVDCSGDAVICYKGHLLCVECVRAKLDDGCSAQDMLHNIKHQIERVWG